MTTQQIVNLPFLYADRCSVGTTTPTTLQITPGQVRDDTNIYDLVVSSILTINAEIVGANGIDIDELATDTWYAVFVIGDQYNFNSPAALISTSLSNPIMPDGYNVKRRIGWIKTDGSDHLIFCSHAGTGNERQYFWSTSEAADTIVLSGGASTTYAAVDCSLLIPETSCIALFRYSYTPKLADNKFFIRQTGTTVTESFSLEGNVADKHLGGTFTYCTSSGATRTIDYKVTTDDGLSLFVYGFTDYI